MSKVLLNIWNFHELLQVLSTIIPINFPFAKKETKSLPSMRITNLSF